MDTAQQIDASEEPDDCSASSNSFLQKVTIAVEDDCSRATSQECCICLERKQQITLPCTHSYCQPCIDQWYLIATSQSIPQILSRDDDPMFNF